MRNIDLIFVIGLGIAMGSILGKLWIVTPTGLMLYQAALICIVWWVLRVFIDYLQIFQRFITQWWGTPPGFWISGAKKDVKAVHPQKRRDLRQLVVHLKCKRHQLWINF